MGEFLAQVTFAASFWRMAHTRFGTLSCGFFGTLVALVALCPKTATAEQKRAAPRQAAAAAAPAPAPPAAGDTFADELKDMTYIGFEETDDVVRVFVHTSEPVKYTVDTSHAHRVTLVLDNCRVPVFNNTRPLDTQYFDGPVTLIEAKPVESPSQSVHIDIHLRHKAVMRPLQKDTFLALEFEK